MAENVYIHIPFCKQKCKYCSFVSFTNNDKINDYIQSLLVEIDQKYKGECLKTLYFGGGTPSLLTIENLKKIIAKFKLNSGCEITLEMNPDDANLEYLKNILKAILHQMQLQIYFGVHINIMTIKKQECLDKSICVIIQTL